MFEKKLMFLILMVTEINGRYFSVGNYSDHLKYDVNLPECGVEFVLHTLNISFGDKCFYEDFPYKTKSIFDSKALKILMDRKNQSSPKPRIFDGNITGRGEAPWTVLLTNRLQYWLGVDTYQCTGVLITFEWVATAAHCDHWLGNTLFVWAGSNKREEGERQYISSDKIFLHPFFKDPSLGTNNEDWYKTIKSQHDIALLKLDRKLTPHKNDGTRYLINTICLPGRNQKNRLSERATFFGFGLIDTIGDMLRRYHEYLLKADVWLNPYDECSKTFCIGFKDYSGPRPCPGDSGGPLVYYIDELKTRAVLLGTLTGASPGPSWFEKHVLNHLNPCRPQHYTKSYWVSTPSLIDWILNTIANN